MPKLVEVALGLEEDRVPEVLEYGLQAGKHNEFFEISSHVGLEKNHTLQHLCHIIKLAFHDEMNPLKERIESFLD
ncbi:hypothetical protein D9M69_720260 [compost metagenome]